MTREQYLRTHRKYPAPAILNRLYWFDGLSIKQIAKRYHMTEMPVLHAMERHNIPRRKRGRRRTGQCIDCGMAVCRVKQWQYFRNGYRWVWSARCDVHHILHLRKRWREAARRRRGGMPKFKWYGPYLWKPLKNEWVRGE